MNQAITHICAAKVPPIRKSLVESITLREDYVVEVKLLPVSYGSREVKEVIHRIREVTANKPELLLIIATCSSFVTLGGIRALFGREALSYALAKAYVVPNNFYLLIARVCMFVVRPLVPLAFFREKEKAEAWLKEIVS